MDNKPKNRAWIKNVAIIFLAVLLVLTFFSNTIMNRTLPEVSTQWVTSGEIVSKVRGTGTVSADGSYEVKSSSGRTIRAVMVKEGQEVNEGDVLFILGEGSTEDIQAAQENLEQLQLSYRRSAISMPSYNYDVEEREIASAQEKVNEAKAAEAAALEDVNIHTSKYANDIMAAKLSLDDARDELLSATADYISRCDEASKKVDEAKENVAKAKETGTLQDVNAAELELKNLNTAYNELIDNPDEAVDSAQKKVDTCQSHYDTLIELSGPYANAYNEAVSATKSAEDELFRLQNSLQQAKTANEKSAALAALELQDLQKDIEKAKAALSELSGGSENEIKAPVAGSVQSVLVSAGEFAAKDQVICMLEVPDMGYSMSFSVTNEQARTLHVGDSATVSNFYWGNQITATIDSIKIDPKNPQSSKLITFSLNGDVNAGSQLTVSIGSRNQNYDLVLPNSAIRSDSNGKFVLLITVKSTPLSNRYIAKRVAVEVVASDDTNSAVTGDINYGDYVIITSNLPIKSGDQVRMTES